MRQVERQQMQFGQVGIERIRFNAKSRDDIPAILIGLQHLYADENLRARLFAMLQEEVLPDRDHRTGRPGMALWNILVLAVLKQGLGCDYDRLQELANEHRTVRRMLGHGDWTESEHEYQLQTLIDNVSLLSPEFLSKVSRLVVESGHEVAGKKPGAPLGGRCDSFVVETDVHHPTDVNLLWDSMRCLIRDSAKSAGRHGLCGWRQSAHLLNQTRRLFQRVNTTWRWRNEARVGEYLKHCSKLIARSKDTLRQLQGLPCNTLLEEIRIENWLKHAERQREQVERRLLKGEKIAHQDKVLSIFEPHTRWCRKGKAGVPVELGVPVCVVEDAFQFVLHHEILWQGSDVDAAVPVVENTQRRFADFRMCSFDRGFHSPENRRRLDGLLDKNVLPRKGRWSRADRRRESCEEFVEARRRHAAVESAINALEHRGLDRIRSRGAAGFERMVALSVLAANVHRLGVLLRNRHRDDQRCRKRSLRAA